MHFYVSFHFFNLPFDFVCRPKAAFCKAKVHRGTPKGGKMSVPVSLNQMAFYLESFANIKTSRAPQGAALVC